jgi:NAD(P)-dependent dehydrogenase (short-subunit alcohol dehydrogenase family)
MTGVQDGRVAIVTGGASGIGAAIAARLRADGARVAVFDLNPDAADADLAVRVDVTDDASVVAGVQRVVDELGGIDILVNNAAHQATFKDIGDISDVEWELTFKVNIHAMFYLAKAAIPHMKPGSAIVNTSSINSDMPNPTLLAYATTKGAIQNFTGGLAQMLAEKGIRVNAVAPGPIWTPLIPSTMPDEAVTNFGKQVPMKRAGQPAELATAYVMLADPLSSYTSGTTVAVTGGKPFI